MVPGGARLSSRIRQTVSVVAPAVAGFFIAELFGGVAMFIFALALGVAAVIATVSPAIRLIEDGSAQPA